MAVKLQDIIDQLEDFAPPALCLSWDNVGLLAGDSEWCIERVLLALDATDVVIREAIDKKCGLILTHHPLIFKPLTSISNKTAIGSKILTLIQNQIAVYSAHTNLDIAPGGVDDLFAKAVGIVNPQPLPNQEDGKSVGRFGPLARALSFGEFIQALKHTVGIDAVTVAGRTVTTVKTVATVCGSGMAYAKLAAQSGADVFVTGDLKYHDGQTAEALSLTIVDVTHYHAEKAILPVLQQLLQSRFPGLEVLCSDYHSDLFKRYEME